MWCEVTGERSGVKTALVVLFGRFRDGACRLVGRAFRVVLVPLILAGTLIGLTSGAVASAATCGWTGLQPPTVGSLTGVAVLSPCRAWAVQLQRRHRGSDADRSVERQHVGGGTESEPWYQGQCPQCRGRHVPQQRLGGGR